MTPVPQRGRWRASTAISVAVSVAWMPVCHGKWIPRAAVPSRLQAEASLRLAALYRRLEQPEVAVPLLVEVIKLMTVTNPLGVQAYQQLVELGFAETPYDGPS